MTASVSRSGPPLPPSPQIEAGVKPVARPQIDRAHADRDVVEAATGMESMFIDQMMQQMRKTVPKDPMGLDSPATEIYQGMLDSEYSQTAAKAGGVGLADLIIDYMQRSRYPKTGVAPLAGQPGNERATNPSVKTASTGGTYAGQSVRSE